MRFVRRLKDFKERLTAGTKITISGWPAKDPQARAFSGSTHVRGRNDDALRDIDAGGGRSLELLRPVPIITYPDVR